jgi:hypothetical protein
MITVLYSSIYALLKYMKEGAMTTSMYNSSRPVLYLGIKECICVSTGIVCDQTKSA